MKLRDPVYPRNAGKEERRQIRARNEERGTGEREAYSPWIQLSRGDFASRGRSSYVPSTLFDRHHHLLSALERTALRCLQLLNPHDIREQFPLQLYAVEPEFRESFPEAQGTTQIARNLGIRHPKFREADPKVMSTDFLVDRKTGRRLAVHVKYAKDLQSKRAIELRTIEAEYWHQRGVEFCVFTEKDIDRTARDNLILLQSYDRRQRQVLSASILREVAETGSLIPMREVLRRLSLSTGKTFEDLVDLVKYAVVTGRLILNLSTRSLSWSQVWPVMTLHPDLEMEADLLQLELDEGTL